MVFLALGIVTPFALPIAPFNRSPVHLPSEETAGRILSVLKQLAEQLGQLFPASHRPRRCAYQRRWYQTAGSAHLSDTNVLRAAEVNLGDGKRAL